MIIHSFIQTFTVAYFCLNERKTKQNKVPKCVSHSLKKLGEVSKPGVRSGENSGRLLGSEGKLIL